MGNHIVILGFFILTLFTGCRKEYDGVVNVEIENTLGDQDLRIDISNRDPVIVYSTNDEVYTNVIQSDFIVLRCISSSDYDLQSTHINEASEDEIKYFYFSTELQYRLRRRDNADAHKPQTTSRPSITIRTVKTSDEPGLGGFEFMIVEEIPE
jgi:hypothetical protein